LLAALARLDESFRLEVAGDGWFLPTAKKLAEGLCIADRTRFLGNIVDVELEEAYKRADLVVVPSIGSEGFGLVVGEARRYGLPVVVSETGALPEWAEGDPGVLVAPRADATGLAAVIRGVREHPPERDHLSSRKSPSLADVIVQILNGAPISKVRS
jgi:glycosyltransferase involved in cell wall biosynthesis